MKFEIDLKEILTDEDGDGETLAESVRRQVIEKLTAEVSKGVRTQINAEVARVMSEELQAAVKEKMPALLEDLLNAEYRSVDRYGDRQKEPTTLRKELVKTITEQMVYKKAQYEHERNLFTKAVDAVVSENIKAMQKDFDKLVIDMFQQKAFEYAMAEMSKKLQVKV